MAKEWDKFQADYKKLQPRIKKYTQSEADKMFSRIKKSLANAWAGEDYFRESMAKARENGVTGKKYADFAKDKDFKDGLSTWAKSAEMHQDEVKLMNVHCDGANSTHKDMAGLLGVIEKDLKKRAKSSSSKKDIEKLRDTLDGETKAMKKVKETIGKLNPAQMFYGINFSKTVDKIMKEGADSQAKAKDDTELPQMLADRVLKGNLNKVAKLTKNIATLCVSAMGKAETDLKQAIGDLKSAGPQFKALKKITDTYEKVQKKYPALIKDSKDRKKILADLTLMAKAYQASERKLRGAATTIKMAAA